MFRLAFPFTLCPVIAVMAMPATMFAAEPVAALRPDSVARAAYDEIAGPSMAVQSVFRGMRAKMFGMGETTQAVDKAVKRFGKSPATKAFVNHKAMSDDAKCDRLFRWLYNRPPTADELKRCREHIGKAKDPHGAYLDLYWAILNSREFLFGKAR